MLLDGTFVYTDSFAGRLEDLLQLSSAYALNNKIVTMDELIEAGFKPLKKSKNTSAY